MTLLEEEKQKKNEIQNVKNEEFYPKVIKKIDLMRVISGQKIDGQFEFNQDLLKKMDLNA